MALEVVAYPVHALYDVTLQLVGLHLVEELRLHVEDVELVVRHGFGFDEVHVDFFEVTVLNFGHELGVALLLI